MDSRREHVDSGNLEGGFLEPRTEGQGRGQGLIAGRVGSSHGDKTLAVRAKSGENAGSTLGVGPPLDRTGALQRGTGRHDQRVLSPAKLLQRLLELPLRQPSLDNQDVGLHRVGNGQKRMDAHHEDNEQDGQHSQCPVHRCPSTVSILCAIHLTGNMLQSQNGPERQRTITEGAVLRVVRL